MPGWRLHSDESPRPHHVWPVDDLIEHDTDDDEGDCPCGPRVDPVERDDGSVGWVIVHHSLDGRERQER